MPDPVDETDLRERFGAPSDRAVAKVTSELTDLHREFVAASPFVLIATADAEHRADLSPRGGPPGFVHVPDARTVVLPERPGNRRVDSLHNLVQQPRLALLFLVPGVGECLRVAGRGEVRLDPDYLASLPTDGDPPLAAIVVTVEEAFHHCPRAILRSGLWGDRERPADPARMGSRPDAAYRAELDATS